MAWKGAPESSDAVAPPRDGSLPDRSAEGAVGDDPVSELCPYLLVPEGGYRLARASREHRCTAERPYDAPSAERQRRLCLNAAHLTCPTFQAARERRVSALLEAGIAVHEGDMPRVRPLGRTAPVILAEGRGARHWPGASHDLPRGGGDADPIRGAGGSLATTTSGVTRGTVRGGRGGPGSPGRDDGGRPWRRLAGPATAVVILLAAAAVIAVQLPGGGTPTPTPSESPAVALVAGSPSAASISPASSAVASVVPTATPSPTPTSAAPSASPSSAPSPTASAALTYRVKAGDTLIAIAARFGVRVADLEQLNGITDPRSLRVGQVLRIP